VLTFVALAVLHLSASSAQAPLREPQMASSSRTVALAYGAGNAIYVQTSTDRGQSFAAPVKVAEVGVLPLSRHRGPRVVFSGTTLVVTAVTGEMVAEGPHGHGLATDGNLYAWRSTDGGQTWSKAARVNDALAAAREGLHTLAADQHGHVFAAWLDLRTGTTQLYGAFSKDAGVTWSRNVLLYHSPDGHICECCHPSAAYAENGSLDVMWRNCMDGSRDFFTIHSRDGKKFGPAQKVGMGTWKINACPMDGGGIAHAGGKTITAWRREEDVFLSQPGKEEKQIGAGHDVTLAANADHVYVAWIEDQALKLWRDGEITTVDGKAAFPSLVSLPDGTALLAWEDGGGISVEEVR